MDSVRSTDWSATVNGLTVNNFSGPIQRSLHVNITVGVIQDIQFRPATRPVSCETTDVGRQQIESISLAPKVGLFVWITFRDLKSHDGFQCWRF